MKNLLAILSFIITILGLILPKYFIDKFLICFIIITVCASVILILSLISNKKDKALQDTTCYYEEIKE